ncbi:MAG: hypothetical protein IJ869_07325 [Clostridiales bacterium]|nr:hypothetical protein [Clostridiales bacterium]
MIIGIDLGSTYSGFARYDTANNRIEPITFTEGAPFSIPSVIYINSKGQVSTGSAAKNKIGKKGVRYEYFKMLLNEKNEDIIKSRGYDDQYTPRVITRIFLEENLKAALRRYNEQSIESLCICVPEIWADSVQTLDGRSILRDILLRESDVSIENDHVQVVTEPEAASAFFAYNYELESHKMFNGHLLLIDYGGGTLDITFTEVKSAGEGNMEIKYVASCGAGENHIDKDGYGVVGNAGIAYIQDVIRKAINDSGEFDEHDIDYSDPDFLAAVVDFESELKSHERISAIEDYFGSYGSYSDFKYALDDEEEFLSFEFKDSEISVSYQCLLKAYIDTIEPVLLGQVRKINKRVEECIGKDPCNQASGNDDDFKIAVVGGFGSCYFVKSQLYEIYNMDANTENDPRIKNITTNKKEQAISLGAALLAAGKVKLQKIARYSIGLYASDASGKFRPYYGIKCHQAIVPGKPYFILHNDSEPDVAQNRVIYSNLAGIKQFSIEFTESLDKGGLMSLNSEMLERLKDLPHEYFWNCGFSMDDSDVVSFHILPKGEDDISKGKTIKLDNYTNMFNVTAVSEVRIQ